MIPYLLFDLPQENDVKMSYSSESPYCFARRSSQSELHSLIESVKARQSEQYSFES
jgi:hypothetical protein